MDVANNYTYNNKKKGLKKNTSNHGYQLKTMPVIPDGYCVFDGKIQFKTKKRMSLYL